VVGWKWPLDIAIGIPWKCCRYAVVELLLLQCYHHGCNIANARRQVRPRCVFSRAIAATFLSTPKQGTVNALIVVSIPDSWLWWLLWILHLLHALQRLNGSGSGLVCLSSSTSLQRSLSLLLQPLLDIYWFWSPARAITIFRFTIL